jgi:Asp-tRNA(Asn)/Glu-tRNA(Gln) amidotransferase A subunit family amidase
MTLPVRAASLAGLSLLTWGSAFAAPPASVQEAAQQVCKGQATSESLVQAAVARAKAVTALNAFVTLDEAGALATAREVDKLHVSQPKSCLPLLGVPIVVKDNIEVAGLPNTGGTPALKGYVPKADAPVVARLRKAGAVVIGKTQLHELAFGISGWNPAYQTGPEPGVRNAYDATRAAGGSSAGTAAALGAGVVLAGLGTDTGGSVRIPCAFNGCASLRPSVGRYPLAGILPISTTRDTAGPMARSIADVELLDRVITGRRALKPLPLRRVRLGLVKEFLAHMDDDTQRAFQAALNQLKAEGVKLVDVSMPLVNDLNAKVGFPVALYEAHDAVSAYLKTTGTGLTIEAMAAQIASPDVKGTYQGLVIPRKLPGPNGTLVDAKPAYDGAMKTARPELQALYRRAFAKYGVDGIVFPTVPKVAMAANAESSSVAVFMATIQNTDPGSNAGVPGVQIPIGLGQDSKLPIGLEIDGPAGGDLRLLRVALAVEAALGRLPPPAGR